MLFIFLVLLCNSTFAQSGSLPQDSHVVLQIKPSKTDPEIKEANTPHYVVYNPEIPQGKLLLFLPGTGGIALKGPKQLFSVAVYQGYHVINLSYVNAVAVAQICRGKTLAKNSKCTEEFRQKRIYGDEGFWQIDDEKQDAIINRLTKLLIYLSEHDKKGNWETYLENGVPKWSEIAVSGQSQGGGMAAFIAKKQLVARVIDFSGGWDFSAKNKIAEWYSNESVTPMDRWYGTYHVTEPRAKVIYKSYQAMKIPEDHIFAFDLEVPSGKKGHSNGVRNIAYADKWIELLGKGN
jgi:hypothetical protein